MSVIDITRHHTLNHDDAMATAEDLAKSLSERFDVAYSWSGDTLTFKRSGAKGKLTVEPAIIHVKMELGFLLRPFKGRIEQEIHKHLDGLLEGEN